ncbi:MAG: M23 family metallopeptidase [Ruminococcaceae bacterium]|nr:M23 family metallopeptidase [Oscillospiraceae bacterium]
MKNKNKSERSLKIKRQLASVGVYIALAVTVLLITSNSVKKILNSSDGYDVPDINLAPQKVIVPPIDTKEKNDENVKKNDVSPAIIPEQKDITPKDVIVSDSPSGVSAQVTEQVPLSEPDIPSSGEPDDLPEPPVVDAPIENDLARFDSKVEPSVRTKPASGYISREFSRDELIYTPTMNDFRTHDGIDITGDIGSPVVAFADGVVEDIYDDPFMGTTVVMRHSGGLVSCYSNLSENLPANVTVGAVISVGSTIGGIGESAIIESAEVPHLHFELYKNELCIDPEEYLG